MKNLLSGIFKNWIVDQGQLQITTTKVFFHFIYA
jgi:hypothetical protein